MGPDEPREFEPHGEGDSPEEPFPGIPPEELPSKEQPLPDDDIPELEPEFLEALRQAGGQGDVPQGDEPHGDPPHGKVPQGGETVEFNPYPDQAAADGPAHGETVEYAPGDAPDEQALDPPAAAPAPTPGPVPAPGPTPAPPPEPPAPAAGTPQPEPPPEPEPAPEPAPEPEPEPEREPFVAAHVLEPERASAPPPSATDRTQVLPDGREQVREAIATAAAQGEPYAPPRPPAGGYGEPAPKQKRLWWRFVLGSFLIVLSFASATTAASVLEIESFIDDVKPIPGIDDLIERVDPGEPQTFLLLGSDRRLEEDGSPGLSDTTILLRLDPEKERIAILNIPRDLKVEIPGHYTGKFNEAYALGGPKLTLKTIRSLTTGTPLAINHVVNINFLGFAQAINAIDCVYIDVDRDYFHSNVGVPAELQYDEIDIDPGYQRLCGSDALDYARYRHTDTDLVRAARQQDFLREARSRVPPIDLFKNREELFGIFAEHTTSDIQEPDEAISVIRLMIGSISAPIEEVRFPATLSPSYVYASRSEIRGAIEKFLDIEGGSGPRGTLEDPQGGSDTTAGGVDAPGSRPIPELENSEPRPEPQPESEDDGLVDTDYGVEVAQQLTPELSPQFPVFFPRRLPEGSVFEEPRAYHVNDDGGVSHQAYRMVLTVQLPDGIHYFGVQGIRDWEKPPILSDPSETIESGGRTFNVFLEGDRVRLVSWTESGNSYWVSNSLLNTLTNDQMLGIARSTGSITPNPKPRRGRNGRRSNG